MRIKNRVYTLLICPIGFAACMFTVGAVADGSATRHGKTEINLANVLASVPTTKAVAPSITPSPDDVIDTREHELDYQNEAYDFVVHRRVYDWQQTSTVLMFFLVMAIVIIGVVMSALHFLSAHNARKEENRTRNERGALTKRVLAIVEGDKELNEAGAAILKALLEKDAPNAPMEFEASLTSVKISSSIIGIVVLTISLAFFLIYVSLIYPITHPNNYSPNAADSGTAVHPTEAAEKK